MAKKIFVPRAALCAAKPDNLHHVVERSVQSSLIVNMYVTEECVFLVKTYNETTSIVTVWREFKKHFKCSHSKIPAWSVISHLIQKFKSTLIPLTDYGEILIVFGTRLIMSYNRLPEFHDYWSSKRSLGNNLIREVISRDRFCLVFRKLYFASPKKPEDASKIYYIEDFANCLRRKFIQNFEDSSAQSIDESVAKFKGRSSLK